MTEENRKALAAFLANGDWAEVAFRGLVDALPVAVYATDGEGRLTYFNEAAVHLAGRSPKPETDRWFITHKCYRPDGTPLSLAESPVSAALQGRSVPEGLEYIGERPDGSQFRFLASAVVIRRLDGQVAGSINVLVDISAQSERAASLLQAIVDSSDDAIVSKDLDGIITSWNKGAERIFGYTAAEVVGRPVLILIPADRLDEEPTILARLRRGERVDHFETIRRRKDGTLIDISLTISPVRDGHGRVIGASKIARDISERKRTDRAIQELNEQLTADLKAMQRMQQLSARFLQTDECDDVLGEILDAAMDITGADMGSMRLLEDGAQRVITQRGYGGAEFPAESGVHLVPPLLVSRSGQTLGTLYTYYRRTNVVPIRQLHLLDVLARQAADLIERKRTEERLWESRQHLRAIYDGTYEYIGLLSPEGTVLDCNRASLEFAGNSRADVIGLPLWETPWFAYTPGAPEKLRESIARARQGEFIRYEAPLLRPSGEVVTFDFSLYPVRNERGEVVSIVPEGRNISDRKAAELRDAFLVDFDDATRGLTGGDEIIGTVTKLVAGRLRTSRCTYLDVTENPTAITRFGEECASSLTAGECFVRHEAKPTALLCMPLLQGGTLVAVLAAEQDSPRTWRHSEVELLHQVAGRCWEAVERARVSHELREREQRYRFLADSIPQMVWTATPEARLDYVNSQVAGFFGITREELVRTGWRSRVHPDDLVTSLEKWRFAVEAGQPYETIYRLKRADGCWRWHLVRAVPLRDPAGHVLQWFGTCTDITEQRTIAEELRRTNRELEEFAYVASHDLQEPLRMVNIYTQQILKAVDPNHPKLSQYANFVRQGVKRMEALIGDLLSFSRTVQSDEPAPTGTADLNAAFAGALSMLQSRIEETGATITAGSLPLVRGDTAQLTQVFQNILSNALKYRKTDVPPLIRVSTSFQDGQWTVTVQDNGIGFDQQYAERIFGLFKRLHKDEYPGTGLGLAICKRIVERYEGRIWAEGRIEEGAAFHFALPEVPPQ